jgi:peptidoglycan/xylan/chitin deacetylase (PgdA/CDA1 family)
MPAKTTTILVIGLAVMSLLTSGCSTGVKANIQNGRLAASPTSDITATSSPTPFQAITNTPMLIPATYTPSPTFTASPTNTPIPTDTPMPTDTPLPTETPEPVWNPGGDVIAPILLYHHVSEANPGNRYYLTPENFRTQLQALRDWGYTPITVTDLAEVLINGGDLPVRPVVITFDDGNVDIYENAFPIMQEMGFVGTFYIVANRLQSQYYVSAAQLQEMANAGWEIGDHGMSHIDLTLDSETLGYEMATSRSVLEDAVGIPIRTFAYPYGKTDAVVSTKVSQYGYLAGMGLGTSWEHTWGTLFYLSRIEVQSSYDMAKFASLLPWSR